MRRRGASLLFAAATAALHLYDTEIDRLPPQERRKRWEDALATLEAAAAVDAAAGCLTSPVSPLLAQLPAPSAEWRFRDDWELVASAPNFSPIGATSSVMSFVRTYKTTIYRVARR